MVGKTAAVDARGRLTGERGRRRLYGAVYLGCAVWFLSFFLSQYDPEYGYTRLIHFGDEFEERSLGRLRELHPYVQEDSSGYDGQFYAQLALAPALNDPGLATALDSPSYRSRRILFSATAYLLGLGRPAMILQAYALQNLLAWVLLAWLMARWLPPRNLGNLMRWLACLFCFGLFESCAGALPDGPGMLLIALSVWLVERGRQNSAAAVLAFSALGKETNLLAALILPLRNGTRGIALARDVARGLAALSPLVLWLWFVGHVFGSSWSFGVRNLAPPLHGFWSKVMELAGDFSGPGWEDHHVFSLLCFVGFSVQCAFFAFHRRPREAWWRLGPTYTVLAIFLGTAVWKGIPGAYLRVFLPITFAFNLLLPGDTRRFVPLWALGNLGLIASFSKLTTWLL